MAVMPLLEEEQALQTELHERRERLVSSMSRYMLWGGALSVAFAFGVWLFFPRYTQLLIYAGLALILAIAGGIYTPLQRRGRIAVGLRIMLAAMLAALFIFPLALPALVVPAALVYVFWMILGSSGVGARARPWLVGIGIAAWALDAVLVYIVAVQWFTPFDQTAERFICAFASIFAISVVLAVVSQIIGEQEKSFCQARQAGWEIERRIQNERTQREQLQQASTEIEQRAAQEQQQREHLHHLVLHIRDAAGNLDTAASEILAATTQQVTGASEQSAAIAQTTATVDEVRAIAEQSTQRSKEVADVAERTVLVSRTGQQAVQDAIDGLEQIRARVESIAENILSLSEQTQQIGGIIASVNEIAAQSNMLALNASVEAARAGEHGRGFAIVASEVRTLAEQSRQATAQVKAILSDIQNATNATVMATEGGTRGVEAGVQLAVQAREAIAQLAAAIDESSRAALQMVASGQQQATGIEQIALAMDNIHQATMQSLANTRQAEQAAQNLSQLAWNLNAIVREYQ